MLTLEKWYLEKHDSERGTFILGMGVVFDHHRLEDGTFIHTSRIEHMGLEVEKKQFLMDTHSGSHYALKVDEMHPKYLEQTIELLKVLGVRLEPVDDDIMAVRRYYEESQLKELREAEEALRDRELLLAMKDDSMYGMMVKQALFKIDGTVREISPCVHTGMFQDSVLITDWEKGEVDFRYFPNGMIEPYHWSDGLDAVVVRNVCGYDISFEGTDGKIKCPAGEDTRIESASYRGEGLFSPDVVNGKSMLYGGSEED